MAKILITGSEGTLGTPMREELLKRGHEVWGLDLQHTRQQNYFRADVANFRQLSRPFRDHQFDFVYHLAAEFGRINGEEYYETLWKTNAIGTRNVIELQREMGFKLIFASSSEVYGEQSFPVMSEDIMDKYPVVQHNDYAITKWVNEMQIMNSIKRYNLPTMRLRFFNAYGPGEYYHNYRSVVCLFCYRALHGLPYQVYKGYKRVFMYIDDFIPTLANSVDRFKEGEVINIGGVEFKTVEEMSNEILNYLGIDDSLVEYLPEDRHNTINKKPDIEKARALLGHNPVVELKEGISLTIDWMRKVYKDTIKFLKPPRSWSKLYY